MGRPRKLKNEDDVNSDLPFEEKEYQKPKYELKPFTNTEELPNAVLDKNGRIIKSGEYRYFLRPDISGRKHELIAKYKNGKGVCTKFVKLLKTGLRTERGFNDAKLLNDLVKMGVPIING